MYGPDEHRNAKRRIDDVAAELDHVRELVASLRDDLRQDDMILTGEVRDALAVAATQLASTRRRLDVAKDRLPEPSKYARLTGEA